MTVRMANTVASRKAKGRRFQQYIAQKFSELTGIPWGPDEQIRSREMGQSGTDLVFTGGALEKLPLSIECKNQETWSVPSWIKQAKENQKECTDWVLFCKRNNETPVVVISDDYYFKLLKNTIEIS